MAGRLSLNEPRYFLMGFPLLQQLSLAGDFAIVVPSGATYARRKFTGEISTFSFPAEGSVNTLSKPSI